MEKNLVCSRREVLLPQAHFCPFPPELLQQERRNYSDWLDLIEQSQSHILGLPRITVCLRYTAVVPTFFLAHCLILSEQIRKWRSQKPRTQTPLSSTLCTGLGFNHQSNGPFHLSLTPSVKMSQTPIGAWKILHATWPTSSFCIVSENGNMPKLAFTPALNSGLSGGHSKSQMCSVSSQEICSYS